MAVVTRAEALDFAESYAKLIAALTDEGFTREEAMQILMIPSVIPAIRLISTTSVFSASKFIKT